MRRAPPLGPHLHHPAVFAGRREHGLALHHVDADRLLHLDVRARLDGGDHGEGVPVIGRGDQYDVEVFLGEHRR